ncbi:unnamed protein product [Candidula unifasciata]|uniref:RING-type E3 ubiquitin transferase n=1 Tax=Candidula unifasciata TaxID=100452 RepID=A0A8S3ZIQ3_9EUPU|nr:unnamed protein product [Candidula unifasciata]
MAEATMVERPHDIYFCHECMREVQLNIPALTCSRCNSEFVEEMESRPAPPPQSSADSRSTDPALQFAELLNTSLFELIRSTGGPQLHRHRYNTRSSVRHDDADSEDDEMLGVAPSAVFHINSGDPQQAGQQSLPWVKSFVLFRKLKIINYVIQRLGSDLGGGRSPLRILHANPGDYAWGPSGLDAIISQLLNHLEGTGAPPAQKDKIDNLPRITIEQIHIENTLQCSICMDDFELAMEARKLPCDHLYHSECIVKWLEMHGTCPVCRKDLNGEDTSTHDSDYTTGFQQPTGEGNGATSSSSTSMGPSTSSSFRDLWRN